MAIDYLGSWMEKPKVFKKKSFLLFMCMLVVITLITVKSSGFKYNFILQKAPTVWPFMISGETITPVHNTKHFMVSAYMDRRVSGMDVRIIGIFKKDFIEPLYCHLWCASHTNEATPARILPHPENFGFPYVTTDVMCKIPPLCDATHVTLLTETDKLKTSQLFNRTWIPIRNRQTNSTDEERLRFNFTVCISNLFGDYNNVLQFAQTMEMYRLLGVNRVVIYKTSCSQDFDRLLQSYSQEGFLEVVPWPIDKHLNPSHGWLHSSDGGDVHYFGQMTTLNECIYRSMERSRYVLLNDMDEIVMPYQHKDLMSLMNTLQQQHPNTGVFQIENHIFPKKHFDPSGRFRLPQWNGVPGVNILEHIYKEEPDRTIYHPSKMIIRPRMVEQTSVHEVLKNFGPRFKVPPDVCHIIHTRGGLRRSLKLEELHVDKRLWDFQEKLIPNVDKVLKNLGLLNSSLEMGERDNQ